ncbi:MAG TPA: winged helix-turn-helix domain-containing protein [Qipengyuania sp.]|nr:winged helix-turn-helix domain-containing protein [Qipengyuania sp.]
MAAAGGSDLAHLPPFRVGPLTVEPSLRRLVGLRGEARTIQPLAMRVLLSLTAAQGETSSRDDLVEACWNQRIVGDDAVHRIISTLRRDLAKLSGSAVRIETISKVGYRLLFDDTPSAETPGNGRTAAISSPPQDRRPFVALAAIGALIVAGVFVMSFPSFERSAEAATTRIGVEPVTNAVSDPQAARFAENLTGDLARLANAATRVSVVDRTGQGAAAADLEYVVRISVERDGDGIAATARMVSTGDNSVFWSRRFVDEDANLPRLRERVAVNTAAMIRCGLEKTTGQIDDPVSLKLFFGACDAFQNEDPEAARGFALRLVEREPDSALGWGCLAMAANFGIDEADGRSSAARAKVESYARRALAIDAQDPRAILTLAEFDRDELPALEILERAVAANPGTPEVLKAYSAALYNAGYVKASVPPALSALARDPTSRYSYELAVRRLLAAGRFDEARAMQERVERLWPGHRETLEHRARLLLYWPKPREMVTGLDTLDDARLAPLGAEAIRWRVDPTTVDPTALDRRAEALARTDPPAAWHLASAMAMMDQPDRALAWLRRAPKKDANNQWSVLFAPHAAELRRDPRFFRSMAELGLVGLWVKRGQWPDFCSEPGLRYNCRASADELTRRTAKET